MVSCVFAYRSCCKHFCRFQALTAHTDREEHVNNKIWATTTHVHCVVHDQEWQRKATGQYLLSNSKYRLKNKACDCHCHLVLIDLSKNAIVIIILFLIAASKQVTFVC